MPETEMTVAESAGPAILARSMHLAYGALRYPRLHRAQWLSPDQIRDLQWRRLERMLRHAYARALLASSYPRHRLRSSMTSGSTGRRTTSYFDEPAWVLAKNLLKLRARRACGVRLSDRIALFQEDAPDDTVVRRGARRQAFTI